MRRKTKKVNEAKIKRYEVRKHIIENIYEISKHEIKQKRVELMFITEENITETNKSPRLHTPGPPHTGESGSIIINSKIDPISGNV